MRGMNSQAVNSISLRIQHVANMLMRESDQILQEQLGIGMSQFRILKTVQANHRLLQRQIASMLHQTEASISRQVALMLQQKLIVTQRNPKDRREHITTLTPKGRRIVEAAEQVLQSFHASFLSDLPEKQQADLLNTLTTIEQRVIARKLP